VIFNLLEEFCGEGLLESFVVDALEGFGVPYTGCHSEGLLLAKNKIVTKIILKSSRDPYERFGGR
jgi:D-alanine-D-alanine ligase-like ATP-grasp enzyme